MLSEDQLGMRIREMRKAKGLSLEKLARQTGFTKGYLSKVENSDKAPPVSTLVVLAEALDTTMSDLFGEETAHSAFSLVKKDQRRLMARDGTIFGYSYETLAHTFVNKHMEPYILTIPAQSTSAIFQHKGEEMLLVIQGSMQFFHGGREYLVEEGDCIYFDSSVPHYGLAMNDQDVKCVMVILVS